MPSQQSASDDTPNHVPANDPNYVRLHITPLDPELLKLVVPAPAQPVARNISFHTIETFPENRYGFVDLPAADAEKLRKKFHGATLKGRKMRVEKARPKQEVPAVEETNGAAKSSKKRKSKHSADGETSSKKRKRDRNTVEGVMLEEGRKVKRGWTIPEEMAKEEKKKKSKKDKEKKKAKKRQKSEYTDKEECLMKIVAPPNAPILEDPDGKKKKGKKGKSARQVTVHEFEHTKPFPTFVKGASESVSAKPKAEAAGKDGVNQAADSSSDSSSSSEDSGDSEKESPAVTAKTKKRKKGRESKESKRNKKSKKRRTESTPDKDDSPMPPSPTRPGSSRPKSSSSMRSLTIKIPPPVTPAADKVHPLEALYKKPKTDDSSQAMPADEPFSFFGNKDAGDEEEDAHSDAEPARSSQPPMTPFSRQDFEWRHVRSAAPTPDTAHPTRTRVFWAPEEGDDVAEEDEDDEESQATIQQKEPDEAKAEPTESDFRKAFYEERGELHRSWVERVKAAKKQKRSRENKARNRRL